LTNHNVIKVIGKTKNMFPLPSPTTVIVIMPSEHPPLVKWQGHVIAKNTLWFSVVLAGHNQKPPIPSALIITLSEVVKALDPPGYL